MAKKQRDYRPFIGLHKELIFNCPEWAALSSNAKVLYQLLKAKWNPKKGEDIHLSYRALAKLAYKDMASSRTISSAFKELERGGWIERMISGGLFGKATRWRLTGKHDGFNA